MRAWKLIALMAVLTAVTAGCRGAVTMSQMACPVLPASGLLFADMCGPLTVDYNGTPVAARSGEASTLYVYDPVITGLDIAWSDASIAAAAAQGRLSRVHYADYRLFQILGVFGRFTVIAYGE
ncbi:MAG: hypothetical protein GXY85_07600 [Candidatus Brocadiaceae bacterium]|nr:hypothetical protein [Candidatus Brocadiaceae bacterium]